MIREQLRLTPGFRTSVQLMKLSTDPWAHPLENQHSNTRKPNFPNIIILNLFTKTRGQQPWPSHTSPNHKELTKFTNFQKPTQSQHIKKTQQNPQKLKLTNLDQSGIKNHISPILKQRHGGPQNPIDALKSSFHGIRASSTRHSSDSDLNPPHPLFNTLGIFIRIQKPHVLEVSAVVVSGAGLERRRLGDLRELEVFEARRHCKGTEPDEENRAIYTTMERICVIGGFDFRERILRDFKKGDFSEGDGETAIF